MLEIWVAAPDTLTCARGKMRKLTEAKNSVTPPTIRIFHWETIILYYIMLDYIKLYRTALYYIILYYYIILHYMILYDII